jgi:hypothetical protein
MINQLIALLKEDKLEYIGSIVLGLIEAWLQSWATCRLICLQITILVALAGFIAGNAGALSMRLSIFSTNQKVNMRERSISNLYGLAYLFAGHFSCSALLMFTSPFVALTLPCWDSIWSFLL